MCFVFLCHCIGCKSTDSAEHFFFSFSLSLSLFGLFINLQTETDEPANKTYMASYFVEIVLFSSERQDSWCEQAVRQNDIFTAVSSTDLEKNHKDINNIHNINTNRKKPTDYRESHLNIFVRDSFEMAESEPLKARYIGYGVVKLYREYDDSKGKDIEVNSDDTTVAIVAVPPYMSPTDLLAFIGESFIKNISHFRLIRSDSNNRFMALMKFRKSDQARRFQDEFNGVSFNSMESEKCHTIFVKSVIFRPLNTPTPGIPYLMEDPFTMQVKKSESSKTLIKELPSCPVCLERMDSEVSGLLTISCQHTFHCDCLSKWRDDTCPVCRYSNLSLNSLKFANDTGTCSSCGGTSNLWVCLICGNVGCGRYDSRHAIEHYESTNHCFSMDISTQRVWDYAGDNYVHRLLQNETDGKLVELGSHSSSSCSIAEDSKGKSLDYSIEYSNVLLSQLESQREYYESRLSESFHVATVKLSQKDEELKRLGASMEKLENLVENIQKKQERESDSLKSKANNTEKMKKLAQTFEKKWKEEKTISEGLMRKLEDLTLQNQEIQSKNQDLEEQVKDLMFFLESQEKFKDASDEVKNGTVIMKRGKK